MENTNNADRIKTHEESGLKYYAINMTAVDDPENTMELRLFESTKPQRLKWENDEETFDEYKIRRKYMRQIEKEQRKGRTLWFSNSWGKFDEANALRVQAAINEGLDLSKLGKF
jgi:hypothetical protein